MKDRQVPTRPRMAASFGAARGSVTSGRRAIVAARAAARDAWQWAFEAVRNLWRSPRVMRLRHLVAGWQRDAWAGAIVLVLGAAIATGLIALIDLAVPILNPGLVYVPVVAMVAYYWGWRHAAMAGLLELVCVYVLFVSPAGFIKPLNRQMVAEMVTLAAVTIFVLAIVQIARARRAEAEREARRFAALNRVGAALSRELDEQRLLDFIARTARELTGAEFAAFTIRPLNDIGQPLVPSEGSYFYLAAIVGVTKAQEELFKRAPLGGEGLLAPIFRHGVPVRVADALTAVAHGEPIHPFVGPTDIARRTPSTSREEARQLARDYAHGAVDVGKLRSLGVPRGHPIVRSFLGVPLLDRKGLVRGGLLLGHSQPDCFTEDDEALIVGLAAEAAIALENARLYHAAQTRAGELDAIFQSIGDGVTLVDAEGHIQRENDAARVLRSMLEHSADRPAGGSDQVRALAAAVASGASHDPVQIAVGSGDAGREYTVTASPLKPLEQPEQRVGSTGADGSDSGGMDRAGGAVVVWHDVTEARRLLDEQRARSETEARRELLQAIIADLPSGVYLVRGFDARLVLANHAAARIWGAEWPVDMPMLEFLATSGTCIATPDGSPIPPDDLATIRALRIGEDIRHHEEVIRQRDGRELPVLLNAVVLDHAVLGGGGDSDRSDGREGEAAAVVVLQDVTALKETERLKDEFIGIAAHELRTPLAAVKGYAETLVMQTNLGRGAPLEGWQREALESIDQAANRLSDLTDDLLDVTLMQAGRLDLHLEPGDLLALARRVVRRMQMTTDRHILKLHATADFIVVRLDPRRMEQVFANLIGNAIKYSPAGGDIDITLSEDATTGAARIDFRDRGIGIPLDQQSRLFGRFARADNATVLAVKGTGLGLYICRELVERHHGRIWFDSVENVGTTFHISLPLLSEDEGDDVPPPQAT